MDVLFAYGNAAARTFGRAHRHRPYHFSCGSVSQGRRKRLCRWTKSKKVAGEVLADGQKREKIAGEVLADGLKQEMIAGRGSADGLKQEMIAGEVLADGLNQEKVAGEVLADGLIQEKVAGEVLADGLIREKIAGEVLAADYPCGLSQEKGSSDEMTARYGGRQAFAGEMMVLQNDVRLPVSRPLRKK